MLAPSTSWIPEAAVVLERGAAATVEELMQSVAARVSPHKRIRALRLVDAIPKSASGKILRRLLIAQDTADGESSIR